MTHRVFRWLLVLAAALLSFSTADARNRWVVFPDHPENLPAVHYANLTATECLSELGSRQVAFGSAPKRRTIDAPVQLQGELRGVRFEFGRNPQQRDVLDCRLLLALDDLARIASAQGIATVRYNSIHRNGWARGRVQGHLGGVAIDITELVSRDGQVLNVKRDFAGERIGAATCGAAAKAPRTRQGDSAARLHLRAGRSAHLQPAAQPPLRLPAPRSLPLRGASRRALVLD